MRTATTSENVGEALLDTERAAQYLSNTKKTLQTWRSTGAVRIPFIKIGASVRYRKSDLDRFIEANRREG